MSQTPLKGTIITLTSCASLKIASLLANVYVGVSTALILREVDDPRVANVGENAEADPAKNVAAIVSFMVSGLTIETKTSQRCVAVMFCAFDGCEKCKIERCEAELQLGFTPGTCKTPWLGGFEHITFGSLTGLRRWIVLYLGYEDTDSKRAPNRNTTTMLLS
jgi:hypothetical protein